FGSDEAAEWAAMRRAGHAVADTVLRDFEEIGGFARDGVLLVLAGKGHNGGDALIAAGAILARFPQARAEVLPVYGDAAMRPLARRAWRDLQQQYPERVKLVTRAAMRGTYELCLDGVFGFQFHPPLDERAAAMLAEVNRRHVRLRAAVDIPSGGGEPGAFRADFTYGTGVLKREVLGMVNAGRLRYLDLGFFATETVETENKVITPDVLAPLRVWRDPQTEKRRQGHGFVLAGSRDYPGAALMAVLAAVRSGAGLVTAFVPESLVPAFAAQVPEAIWVGWPETPEGGLALEGLHLLRERMERASALVMGPGIGRARETLALMAEVLKAARVPVLVDADALQPEVLAGAKAPLVLTPHAGEFARIAGGKTLRDFARESGATVVLKGPVTQVCAGGLVYHSLFGGPVLARGGSGDLLAGMIGTQLARAPDDVLAAVCGGVAWHGLAAEALARAQGTEAVRTTQLLDFLTAALRLGA
ncbi:MAG: NAD(P)H-hydrate dehydratase, partial [Opitutaceae bacterium]|nr:NAD(P)H-hydrate dehydratase [Opitutaceae bacterium]